MFPYRVRKAVDSLIGALDSVEVIVFGGGIAENGMFLRRVACDCLSGFGLELDNNANEQLIDKGLLSTSSSRLQAWVIPNQEGLQIAHECSRKINGNTAPLLR